MSDLEINQPGPFRFLVIDYVSHRGITVRPGTAEFLALEMMRAPIFTARSFQHPRRQRAAIHVFPKIIAG